VRPAAADDLQHIAHVGLTAEQTANFRRPRNAWSGGSVVGPIFSVLIEAAIEKDDRRPTLRGASGSRSTMGHFQFQSFTRRLSQKRSRNEVLDALLPKIFGLLWERGEFRRVGVRARIDGAVELGGFAIHDCGFALHAYVSTGTYS